MDKNISSFKDKSFKDDSIEDFSYNELDNVYEQLKNVDVPEEVNFYNDEEGVDLEDQSSINYRLGLDNHDEFYENEE